jgi:hypothetical protein
MNPGQYIPLTHHKTEPPEIRDGQQIRPICAAPYLERRN